jgi:hypothetical protein
VFLNLIDSISSSISGVKFIVSSGTYSQVHQLLISENEEIKLICFRIFAHSSSIFSIPFSQKFEILPFLNSISTPSLRQLSLTFLIHVSVYRSIQEQIFPHLSSLLSLHLTDKKLNLSFLLLFLNLFNSTQDLSALIENPIFNQVFNFVHQFLQDINLEQYAVVILKSISRFYFIHSNLSSFILDRINQLSISDPLRFDYLLILSNINQ